MSPIVRVLAGVVGIAFGAFGVSGVFGRVGELSVFESLVTIALSIVFLTYAVGGKTAVGRIAPSLVKKPGEGRKPRDKKKARIHGVVLVALAAISIYQFEGTPKPIQGSIELDGAQYTGDIRNNTAHGSGTMTWPDGNKYVGEFHRGMRHGQGTFTYSDGSRYVGEFRRGMESEGTLTYSDGSQYVGWFRGGEPSDGTLTYSDGSQYVGQLHDDKRNGLGTMTYPDGTTKEGMWRDGEFTGKLWGRVGK